MYLQYLIDRLRFVSYEFTFSVLRMQYIALLSIDHPNFNATDFLIQVHDLSEMIDSITAKVII